MISLGPISSRRLGLSLGINNIVPGKEIRLLKKYGIPVAVITNASLINHKSVQDDLMESDWVSLKNGKFIT